MLPVKRSQQRFFLQNIDINHLLWSRFCIKTVAGMKWRQVYQRRRWWRKNRQEDVFICTLPEIFSASVRQPSLYEPRPTMKWWQLCFHWINFQKSQTRFCFKLPVNILIKLTGISKRRNETNLLKRSEQSNRKKTYWLQEVSVKTKTSN